MASTQQTVLITGASRGIGLALAEHYVKAGWKVIAGVRNPANADKLTELQPFKIVQLDISDEASIASAAKELDGEAIDVLINNAGILSTEVTKASLMESFEVNAAGPFLVTRAFDVHLKAAVTKNQIAKVVNVSTALGSTTLVPSLIQFGSMPAYRASKAALNMFSAVQAQELKPLNIAMFVISPGYVATDINDNQGGMKASDSAARIYDLIAKGNIETTGSFADVEMGPLAW